MDDYYEILGVDDDAPVNDIKAAYRDRKAEVAALGTDAAKADAAALNKAWNVLSDPYQRGRYDQKRASGELEGDDDTDGDVDEDGGATPVRKSAKKPAPRTDRRGRPLPEPTVTLPAGMSFPSTRRRIIAMSIDLGLLVVLFIGSQLLVVSLEKSHHPKVYHQVVNVLPDQINKASDATSKAKKAASPNVDCNAHPTAEKDVAYCNAKAHEKDLNKQLADGQSVLAPTSRLISGLFFVVTLILLLGASVITKGQTVGKRLQKIRVVRLDGSPARVTDLFRRYMLLVFAAYALFTFLGPVGSLIVVFVSTMWTRNPNQQGLQDRFAKTLVVSDDAE